MLRWLRSLFAWETVLDTGAHRYVRNAVTGERRVLRSAFYDHQPIDGKWLETGVWCLPPTKLPKGASSAVRPATGKDI